MSDTLQSKISDAEFFAEVERLLGQGMSVITKTKGSSMLPFIRGSRDSVKLVRAEELSVGDIVLARFPGDNFILHRIYAFRDRAGQKCAALQEGGSIELMGDGNLKRREKCSMGNVIGKAVSIVRPDGRELACDSRFMTYAALCWRTVLLPFRRIFLAVIRRTVYSE